MKTLPNIDNKKSNVLKNYKNFNLLTNKPNASNRFNNKLLNGEEYFKRIVLLDPTDNNYDLYHLKSGFMGKILQTEQQKNEIEKKLKTKKDLSPVNTDINNLLIMKKSSQASIESSLVKRSLVKKEKDKKEIFNMEKIVHELKSKDSTAINKLENLNKETKWEDSMKELREINTKSTQDAKGLYSLLKDLETELIEKQSDLTIVKNKQTQLEAEYLKRLNKKSYEEIKSSVVIIHKEEENEHLLKMKQLFNTKIEEYTSKKRNIEEHIIKIKLEIANIRQVIKGLREKIENNKKELKQIRNKLIVHYHKLLIEGNDVRNNGIVWIILAIWNLDAEIIIDYFPDYLDEISINYLFLIARKNIELRFIDIKINEVRQKIKLNREREKNQDYNNDTFKTELNQKQVLMPIRDNKNKVTLKSRSSLSYNEINTFKNIINNIVLPHIIDPDNQELMNVIRNLESKKEEMKNIIEEERKKEIDRIHKEFLYNNYENRFKTTIEILLKALVGTDSYNNEINNLIFKEKGIVADIKKTRIDRI